MRHLPSILEAMAAGCLLVFAALIFAPLAWLVAGLALAAKAYEIETRGAPSDRPARSARSTKRRGPESPAH